MDIDIEIVKDTDGKVMMHVTVRARASPRESIPGTSNSSHFRPCR
jgi:hypothetical protein